MAIPMVLMSPGIDPNDWIPPRFTAEGEGRTPPLLWKHPPPATRSLILIMRRREGPENQGLHWLVYDIPPDCDEFREGGPLPEGAKTGRNDFGEVAYHPPGALPSHELVHYDFTIYATDLPALGLGAGATLAEVKARLVKPRPLPDIAPVPAEDPVGRELHAMGHVLDHAELTGHYALNTDRRVSSGA